MLRTILTIFILGAILLKVSAQQAESSKLKIYSEPQLVDALLNAKPGDIIELDGKEFVGNFIITSTVNGTKTKPIILRGTNKTILNGSTINKGYVLHCNANFWIIENLTIKNGLKGIILDGANHNKISNITVFDTGEEALHLRKFSSYNLVENCTIYNTGLKTPDYGEGIYIGSAVSNWNKYTNGEPDKCDSNVVIKNSIGPNVSAECIDIKEGTTGGTIKENSFNSTGITGANSGDSWMDVKGNGYLIENNIGFNPIGSVLKDGYQVHCAVDGWGNNNIFKNNISEINVDGYGINVVSKSSKGNALGNVVYRNNVMKGLNKNITNIELTD